MVYIIFKLQLHQKPIIDYQNISYYIALLNLFIKIDKKGDKKRVKKVNRKRFIYIYRKYI